MKKNNVKRVLQKTAYFNIACLSAIILLVCAPFVYLNELNKRLLSKLRYKWWIDKPDGGWTYPPIKNNFKKKENK